MLIRGGRAAILMVGAGGILSGCALPFAGSLVFSDLLTGISLLSSVATGKGATEIALDIMTGKDCRLLEGALRADRDFCEEPGSAATDEDFKGLVAWLEEDEPATPLPGEEATIMVADIGPPEAAPNAPVPAALDDPVSSAAPAARPRDLAAPVAVASLTELPREWIVLAAAEYGPEFAGFAAIAPAAQAPGLIYATLGDAPLPFMPAARSSDGNLADWALEKLPADQPGLAEDAFTLPTAKAQAPRMNGDYWNIPWPAVDIENPPPRQDAFGRPASAWVFAELHTAPAAASAPNSPAAATAPILPAPAKPTAAPPPAPAKPVLLALLPHPEKPVLQASAPGPTKNARAVFEFLPPAPEKPVPEQETGPVLALLARDDRAVRTPYKSSR